MPEEWDKGAEITAQNRQDVLKVPAGFARRTCYPVAETAGKAALVLSLFLP